MKHRNLKKFRIFALLLILILTSCLNYFENSFHRIYGGESIFILNSYEPIDTLNVEQIRFCKILSEPPNNRIKTEGKIKISSKNIDVAIVKSLKKNLKHINYEFTNDTLWKYNCDYLTGTKLLSDYRANLTTYHGNSLIVTLNIDCFSRRDNYYDGFYGGLDQVFDEDKHDLKFLLRLAIFQDDKLIYMDNYGHLDVLMAEHDENVHYEIPQNIIDSLVTKSLAEYKKRLK